MTHSPSRPSRTHGRLTRTTILVVWWMILVGGVVGAESAAAQSTGADGANLVEHYQTMRRKLLVRRRMQRSGGIETLPPKPLPMSADSLHPPSRVSQASTPPKKSFPVDDVRTVRRLERNWFLERFADVKWSFLGSTPHHTFFDTTQTRVLRARLQAQFGDPTRTLGDAPFDTSRSARSQFEYWFVVNDSIPVQVADSDGPWGRGLILMAERQYRDRLRLLRGALLARLPHAERASYVDYYYDDRAERWYRTGYDGRAFFLERISRSEILPGRRAHLDAARASHGASRPADEDSP